MNTGRWMVLSASERNEKTKAQNELPAREPAAIHDFK